MDELKGYVFELQGVLDSLIENVAGREGVAEDLCEAAQAACNGAAKKLRMSKWGSTPAKEMEVLEKTLRSLALTYFLLDSTPEIYDSADKSIQEKYEACMCLLNQINSFALVHHTGFKEFGVHLAHPLVEDMNNALEQVAKLLEITHDEIIIETDKTDEIKQQLGECFIQIDNTLKILEGFLNNDNAAEALRIKYELVKSFGF